MNKYLVVGLGNMEEKYNGTRHNIGFDILDTFVAKHNASYIYDHHGHLATFQIKNKKLFCLKPDTYVNLSGKSIAYHLNKNKIPTINALVLSDDVSIPFGKLRLRLKGGHNGHNGLKNIEEHLKTKDYARLKFGIGGNYPYGKQIEFVLGKWKSEEKKIIHQIIEKSCLTIEKWMFEGFQKAATFCN